MRFQPRKRRWLWRGAIVLLSIPIIGWAVESPARPCFSRVSSWPHSTLTLTAYVHGNQPHATIDKKPEGSIGSVRFVRLLESCDGRWLGSQVHEYRHLHVMINGATLSPQQTSKWRRRVAAHFGEPAILLGERDDTHRLWLGYPGDFLIVILVPLLYVSVPAVFIGLLVLISKSAMAYQPIDYRLVALANHICPHCRYDIRGLTGCRCPECGETWLPGQVPEGL